MIENLARIYKTESIYRRCARLAISAPYGPSPPLAEAAIAVAMTRRVLVTGGAGFGTHLVRSLHARGYSVRVLDIFVPMYGSR